MSLTRFCSLLLFFCSLAGAVVFYIYGQPATGRWFLIGIALGFWLLVRQDDTRRKD